MFCYLRQLSLFILWLFLASASAQHLAGHSISEVLDTSRLAVHWFLGGTAVPIPEGLVLSPGVPKRVGLLWSVYPLMTSDFEVTLRLRVTGTGPQDMEATEGGFAFWIVRENVTEKQQPMAVDHVQKQDEIVADTWYKTFSEAGYDLLGYRSKFEGLGVFFVDDKKSSSVRAWGNDGQKQIKYAEDLLPASPKAVKFDFQNGQAFTVKVRVHPTSANVEVVGQGKIDISQGFQGLNYIGLTSYGGNLKEPSAKAKVPFVEVLGLSTVNFDTGSKGEEEHNIPKAPSRRPEEKVDVLAETSSFKDHRAESNAIKDLTNTVFKLVVESGPLRMQLSKSLEALNERVDNMERSFKELKEELDKKTGHKLGSEFEQIKNELSSISSDARKHAEESHSTLTKLHSDLKVASGSKKKHLIDKELTDLSESHSRVLNQLESEHQWMFGSSIAVIGFIVIAGLSLYNKFRCWEKKHVL